MQPSPRPVFSAYRERLLTEEILDLNHRRALFPGFRHQRLEKPADKVVHRGISIQRHFPRGTNQLFVDR
jgi:hypothetical protein